MTITPKNIVEEIRHHMNIWERAHNPISAQNVLNLVDAYSALYVVGFISERSYKRDSDYIYTCKNKILYDYKHSEDAEYNSKLEYYMRDTGLN